MFASRLLYLLAIPLLSISCTQSDNVEKEQNITQPNTSVVNISSDLLKGIKPADAKESLFVGDSDNKVKKVMKSAILLDTTLVLRYNTYFDTEINTTVKTYSLSQGGVMGEMYLTANDKLRNIFAIMGKIKSSKKNQFINAIKKDFVSVKKGVFKSAASPKGEYAVFLMIEDVKRKKIAAVIITGPNSNISDDERNQYVEMMRNIIGENTAINTTVSFVE